MINSAKYSLEYYCKDLFFYGFLVLNNTVLPEASALVNELMFSGIRPVLCTGDNAISSYDTIKSTKLIKEGDTVIYSI